LQSNRQLRDTFNGAKSVMSAPRAERLLVAMPNETEINAVAVSIQHLRNKGYVVADVSRDRNHKGYDLLATKNGKKLKIEVKGCTRMWQIPDPYVTEFDTKMRLVADFLCVVYFIEPGQKKLCMIPREAISPDDVVPKSGYRIRSGFKKQEKLERFLEDVSPDNKL
jgi:hypothetical protein